MMNNLDIYNYLKSQNRSSSEAENTLKALLDRSIVEIEIPEGIVTIGTGAFLSSTRLAKVVTPTTLASIGSYCFQNCNALVDLNFEKSNQLTTLNSYAFNLCSKLENVVLPKSVKNINNQVFSNCKALKNVTIAHNILSISNTAFLNCTGITLKIDKPKGSITDAPWGAISAKVIWSDGEEVFGDFKATANSLETSKAVNKSADLSDLMSDI